MKLEGSLVPILSHMHEFKGKQSSRTFTILCSYHSFIPYWAFWHLSEKEHFCYKRKTRQMNGRDRP